MDVVPLPTTKILMGLLASATVYGQDTATGLGRGSRFRLLPLSQVCIVSSA